MAGRKGPLFQCLGVRNRYPKYGLFPYSGIIEKNVGNTEKAVSI